jgi:drug/metabolite transporter (DMT)-like permease
MHHFLFFMTSFIWGSSFILMKRATDVFGPMTIGGMRTLGGLLFLWVIMKFLRKEFLSFKQYGWSMLTIACAGNVIPFCIQPFLIESYGSGFIGMMVGLVPMFTLLIAKFIFNNKISSIEVAGILMGLICIIGIFSDGLKRSFTVPHLLIAILVPLCYAFTNSYTKEKLSHLDPMSIMSTQLIFATCILNPIAFFNEKPNLEGDVTTASLSLILLSFFGTGLAGYMFFKMIKLKGAVYTSMVTYVIPIYALLIGWLDGENVTFVQIFCVVGIIFSILLTQYSVLKKSKSYG